MRSWSEQWLPGNYEKNVAAVKQLGVLAAEKDISVAQLALAWLLAQDEDIVPIPGTRSQARLAENVGAADVTLTDADLERVLENRAPRRLRQPLPRGDDARLVLTVVPRRAQPGSADPRGESPPAITAQRRSAAFEGSTLRVRRRSTLDRAATGFIHDHRWIQAQIRRVGSVGGTSPWPGPTG